MKYRMLSSNGDYVFGQAGGNFYKDTPMTVGQAVETRLRLMKGEWMLDITQGTAYNSNILGAGKITTYDLEIQSVILNTPGVRQITNYSSGVDPTTRTATINATIDTVYGQTTIQANL